MNGFRNFFGNRYGIDNLNITLIVVALALSIICRFFPRSVLLPALGMLLIVLVFYRALSTKLVVRRSENEKFLGLWYAVRDWFQHPHFGGARDGKRDVYKRQVYSRSSRAVVRSREMRVAENSVKKERLNLSLIHI